ncbi:DUF3857 domain-containing protein [Flavobacterium sp. H122]|uniref:DUF3857 domain-containing protein n=1 Tax=Flavobacterium sp. H122 TaxID=2529860 RepID=UPI0010AAEE9C|nr:DUF3857 domain-containing protein [Flavobacterium sp. H122]
MKKIIVSITVIFCNFLTAQEYKNYDWGKAEPYAPLKAEEELGEINILNKRIKEFVVDKKENYDFTIAHTKTFVNSDEAIERNNKVYIPFKSEGEEIIMQKVRVIKPDGKVIELNSSDIKESEDQERNVKYKYFALTGLEKRCVVEQLIIGKYIPKLNGSNIVMQDEYLNKNISYEIIYPNHLIFTVKPYNGLPEFVENEKMYTGKISKKIEVESIPFLKNEDYSNYAVNAKRFTYKLSGNLYIQKYDLYNYKSYTSDVLGFVSGELDSKEKSALNKFVKQIPAGQTNVDQILKIEEYVKKNIGYYEKSNEAVGLLTTLNNKFASSYGLLKLYKSIFDLYKIESEVVITSDRFKNPMDPKLETYSNLDDFVLYFPELKGYLCPTEIEYRYPNIPFKWTNSYAIFTKYTEFGGAKIPDYEIKKIETPGIDFTHDEMNITVDFSASNTKPAVSSEIQFNGYSAFSIQPFYDFIPEDKHGDFEKELAENYAGKKEDVTIITENKGTQFLGVKPFVFKANYSGENLIEKVGDKILFKVGLVIGKQAELYQKDKRQMPVEIQYPHGYLRKVKVILPKGYALVNPEKINSNYITNYKNNESCKFSTSYKMTGQELIIENIEFYKDVELPLDSYESYIKVINAAADFNKLVLVLQKV